MRFPALCRMTFLLCTSLFTGAAAFGQEAGKVEEKSVDQQVIELFDRGTSLYMKSQWADAEAMFQAAWNLKQSYDIAGNLGEVELKIGQVREAAEHLAYSLRQFPPTGKDTLRKQIQRFYDEARKEVVAIRVRANIDGAQILLNGQPIGQSPMPNEIYANPGRSTIEARMFGHEPAIATVESAKGWSEEIVLTLKPKKEEPVAKPGGAVGAGGAGAGAGGRGFLEGKHSAIWISGAGVAGASLILGIVATAVANGKSTDADAKLSELTALNLPCSDPRVATRCVEQRDTLASQSTWSNVAVSAFVVGGVAAAATAAYIFWPAPSGGQSAGRVVPVPVASKDGGGVWMIGTF